MGLPPVPLLDKGEKLVIDLIGYCCSSLICASGNDYKEFDKTLRKHLNNGQVRQELQLLQSFHCYTYSHSINVAMYSLMLGLDMQLSSAELSNLIVGGALHDMGKTVVGSSILDKQSRLTEAEFSLIKLHPSLGVSLVSTIDGLPDEVKAIVLQHHEKLDGTGYPQGLHEKGIQLLAQVVCVADMFDAITSSRSYHKERPVSEAIGILDEDANVGRINKDVVNILRMKMSN